MKYWWHPSECWAKARHKRKNIAFAVVGYNEGNVNCYLVPGSFNAVSISNAIEYPFLPYLPRDSFLVLDNASIHNDVAVQNVLVQKNIPSSKCLLTLFTWIPLKAFLALWKPTHLRLQGSTRANGMVSPINASAGGTVPVVQSFYRRSWQVQF